MDVCYGFRIRLILTEDRPAYPAYDEKRLCALPASRAGRPPCAVEVRAAHPDCYGVETTKITGSRVKVKLSPGYARTVHEKWARARWTLYVNPTTYLPVRMYGSTQTFGGSASTLFASVTDVQWLPPTAANTAKALVTIPAGFHRVSSPADQ